MTGMDTGLVTRLGLEGEETMTEPKAGTREEWLASRLELLVEVASP